MFKIVFVCCVFALCEFDFPHLMQVCSQAFAQSVFVPLDKANQWVEILPFPSPQRLIVVPYVQRTLRFQLKFLLRHYNLVIKKRVTTNKYPSGPGCAAYLILLVIYSTCNSEFHYAVVLSRRSRDCFRSLVFYRI